MSGEPRRVHLRLRQRRARRRVFLSEKSRAQIQPVGGEQQRDEQADAAEHDDRLERCDFGVDSRCAGQTCDDGGHLRLHM